MLNRRRLIIQWLNEKWRLLKLIRGIITKRKADLKESDATVAEYTKQIELHRDAPLVSKGAVTTDSEYTIYTDTEAPIDYVPAKHIETNRIMKVTKKLGIIAYKIGEGRAFKILRTKTKADVQPTDTDVLTGMRTAQTDNDVSLHFQDSACVSIDAAATNDTEAGMIRSTAMATQAVAKTSTKNVADFIYWYLPEFENGNLTIKQAYNATQTDDLLEVI